LCSAGARARRVCVVWVWMLGVVGPFLWLQGGEDGAVPGAGTLQRGTSGGSRADSIGGDEDEESESEGEDFNDYAVRGSLLLPPPFSLVASLVRRERAPCCSAHAACFAWRFLPLPLPSLPQVNYYDSDGGYSDAGDDD
jgi:hypothetical protein